MFEILIVLLWAVWAAGGAWIGEQRGHGAGIGLVVGFLLGPIGWLLLAVTKGSGPTAADRERQRQWEQWNQWQAYQQWQSQQRPPDPPNGA